MLPIAKIPIPNLCTKRESVKNINPQSAYGKPWKNHAVSPAGRFGSIQHSLKTVMRLQVSFAFSPHAMRPTDATTGSKSALLHAAVKDCRRTALGTYDRRPLRFRHETLGFAWRPLPSLTLHKPHEGGAPTNKQNRRTDLCEWPHSDGTPMLFIGILCGWLIRPWEPLSLLREPRQWLRSLRSQRRESPPLHLQRPISWSGGYVSPSSWSWPCSHHSQRAR